MPTDRELLKFYSTVCCLKSEFHEFLVSLKKSKIYRLVNEPIIFPGYKGEDIQILNDQSNWYPWQQDLYNELYFPTGEIRLSNNRKIIFIYYPVGNCGKSMWIKHLYIKNPAAIAKIAFGTASQLRSSLINSGNTKNFYFVDLPRSKEKYASDHDLLNAIEDLKNGFIVSPMYGKEVSLVLDPPHIVIFSNYLFEDCGLSKDRWQIYTISENKKLFEITEEILKDRKTEES